ncbi:sensor histidine kinase [Poseidonibacter sp.]|uniref:sensor histidine kinase n=1 Tax=Poseidonibacter sp. TaxID=2321188 RepID=UPI003C77C8F4
MKYILLFLLFVVSAFSDKLIEVKILQSNPQLNFQNIKDNKDFEKTKFPIIIQNNSNEYFIKISFKEKLLTDNSYIFFIESTFGLNEFDFNKDIDFTFIGKNTIEFNNTIPKNLYLKVDNTHNLIYIDSKLFTKQEYYENINLKNKLYGLAYGIVFTAFLYYLLFYIYSRQKINLYYSLTQVFSLFILLVSHNTDYSKYDFISVGFIIFSAFFTKEFLETKKNSPKIDKLINFIIAIYILDIFINFEGIFPIAIFLIFYPISAIIIYNKTKRKPILFYIFAWGLVVLTFIFITIEVYIKNIFGFFVNSVDILHIILPLESMILAIALSYSLKVFEDEKDEKEKLLIHQSKLASIGEMINNIAHQWRQPLTHLNYIFMNISKAFEHNKLTKEYLDKKTNEAEQQLEHMSHTIDIFKDFYSPKDILSNIHIEEEINNAVQIISSTFEKENIQVKISGDSFTVFGLKGEISQVALNILTNSKDAFITNNIKDRFIHIILEKDKIKLIDNAGGISDEIQQKMFTPYYSTKKDGSGIGLYMSKIIIEEHFNGKITHKNKNEGSLFLISLN